MNWSPSYAFDLNRRPSPPTSTTTFRRSSSSTIPTSTARPSRTTFPWADDRPADPVSEPQSGQRLQHRSLRLRSGETDTTYVTPVAMVYLALPGGQTDYLGDNRHRNTSRAAADRFRPDRWSAFPTLTPQLQLGIYQGNGQFGYVSCRPRAIPIRRTSGRTTRSPATRDMDRLGRRPQRPGDASTSGNLPTPATGTAGQVYWYQVVFVGQSRRPQGL